MTFNVNTLLIVAAIGISKDDALATFGSLDFALGNELMALLANTFQEDRCRLVIRVLRYKFALHCHLEDGLAQSIRQLSIKRFTFIFKLSILINYEH